MSTKRDFTIRGWLLYQPRPSSLRLHCGTDRHDLPIQNGQSWARIAQSVDAMAPDMIQALDAEGKVLRACRPYEQQSGDDDDDENKTRVPQGTDPETARWTLFAQLLSEAYRHANEVAFGKMVELFGAVSKRGESLERSLASTERMLRKAYEDQLEQAMAQTEDPLTQMASAFMGGQAAGTGANGANGANGGKQ